MFDKNYEERLSNWQVFRSNLNTSSDALLDVIRFYQQAPIVSIHTDPYNEETWPSPWELLYENQYCSFCKILGMCYSLQLTESFKDKEFEIPPL